MLNKNHLSRIDLNLLVVFSFVLEERHVARAAGRLNLTPSAVSHALVRLRQLLNDPLFLRTAKGVVPTARALWRLANPWPGSWRPSGAWWTQPLPSMRRRAGAASRSARLTPLSRPWWWR